VQVKGANAAVDAFADAEMDAIALFIANAAARAPSGECKQIMKMMI
jgi:hypothetical protein